MHCFVLYALIVLIGTYPLRLQLSYSKFLHSAYDNGIHKKCALSKITTSVIGAILSILYGFLYVLLQVEDYALLLGSIGLFVILGLFMYVTRKIDWYTVIKNDDMKKPCINTAFSKERSYCSAPLGKRITLMIFSLALVSFLAGFIVPERVIIPVAGAGRADWNHHSFWHSPWGYREFTKGIDIFAAKGAPVISSTPGFVIYKGIFGLGGNVVAVIGPKWRIHYYAHLDKIDIRQWSFARHGQKNRDGRHNG